MITIRGFTISYTNAAFLGIGFCLGYAQAVLDSDQIAETISDLADAVRAASTGEATKSTYILIDPVDVVEGTATEIKTETPEGEPIQ